MFDVTTHTHTHHHRKVNTTISPVCLSVFEVSSVCLFIEQEKAEKKVPLTHKVKWERKGPSEEILKKNPSQEVSFGEFSKFV